MKNNLYPELDSLIRAVQSIVGVDVDGDPRKKTWESVYKQLTGKDWVSDTERLLKGDGTWPWSAIVKGEDIIVRNATCTCFGGNNDPQDSGETASGINTKGNDTLLGCALPMIYKGNSPSLLKALGGSPIPKMPWKTLVEVTSEGKKIVVPVIDLGPAKYTGNAIDLTIGAARLFKPTASATNFKIKCDFRIIGGAKFATLQS